METNQERILKNTSFSSEHGSGLVYVLVAVALFAALSFTLMRQTDTNEANTLSDERAELYASQLINYAAQAKSVVDQMLFTGSGINDLDFSLPGQAGFTSGSQMDRLHHVFHPEGGGLNLGTIPAEAIAQASTDPVAGWYMGRFNNIGWSKDANDDVVLTAHQINQTVCEKINEKITGSTTIPVLGAFIKTYLIDDRFHTGTNDNFSSNECSPCDGYPSLCISEGGSTPYSFYNIIADR